MEEIIVTVRIADEITIEERCIFNRFGSTEDIERLIATTSATASRKASAAYHQE